MQPPRWLTRVLDTLGMLGLMMRSKRISAFDETTASRQWGPATQGFALSILALPDTARNGEPVKLTLALRNDTGHEVQESVPAWLRYFDLELTIPAGGAAALTAYGEALLGSASQTSMNLVLSPERPLYVELPLSDLYAMTVPGTYRVTASCPAPASPGNRDGAGAPARCRSNTATITLVR